MLSRNPCISFSKPLLFTPIRYLAQQIPQDSVWKLAADHPTLYPKLTKNFETDVLVVGAGITGITAAWQLTRTGKRVVVIEAGKVSGSTTGYSTANLYIPVQPSYSLLKMQFGKDLVKQVVDSRRSAIDFIERTIRENKINCNFIRRPSYFFTRDSKKNLFIEKEVETLREAGVDMRLTNDFPLPLNFTRAAVLENQARFNPFQYTHALAYQSHQQGCHIFENTPLIKLEETKDQVTAYTKHHTIKANKLIMATHIPKGIHKTQFLAYPHRSYAVAVRLKDNNYVNGNFWDVGLPFYAISTHNVLGKQLDLMIVAGHSHKIGHPKEGDHVAHFTNIENYIRKNFEVASFEARWSAQHYQAADGLPYIGLASRTSNHVYVGTGYHTDGLVYGTAAGLLLSDLVFGKPNPWEKVYTPNRFTPLASSLKFFKENAIVSFDYIKGFLDSVQAREVAEIKKGEGKIMKLDGKKYGVYRDEQNELHVVSALCTHMYCTVKWNDAERSWDCPCHGSRFTTDGEVIEGPALTPLPKMRPRL